MMSETIFIILVWISTLFYSYLFGRFLAQMRCKLLTVITAAVLFSTLSWYLAVLSFDGVKYRKEKTTVVLEKQKEKELD